MRSDLTPPWLLVATPQLADPNFKRSVVLIVEHDERGAFGLILNRPTELSLAEAITKNPFGESLPLPHDVPVWRGGPVATGTGLVLNDETPVAERRHQLRWTLTSSADALATLVNAEAERRLRLASGSTSDLGGHRHRFLIGYAGWGSGQLEREVAAGGWAQIAAGWQLVFGTAWPDLWESAFGQTKAITAGTLEPTGTPYTYLN